MSCRHARAYPKTYGQRVGLCWCPDCGATREIESIGINRFTYTQDRWVMPKGIDSVMRQLNQMEARKLKKFRL